MGWPSVWLIALTIARQSLVTGLVAQKHGSRHAHQPSMVRKGLPALPIEPFHGTLEIDPYMTTIIASGAGEVNMTVDLNSVCTWWPNVSFSCENSTTGLQDTVHCNPAFKYAGGGGFSTNDHSQTPVRCACDNQRSNTQGTYVQGIFTSGNLTVGEFWLPNQHVLFAESFTSNSSSFDAIMSHDAYSRSSGVLGLGQPASLYQGNTDKPTPARYSGLLHGLLTLPPGTAPVNVMTVAMPRDSETGFIVIGGEVDPTAFGMTNKSTTAVDRFQTTGNMTVDSHVINVDWLGPPGIYFITDPNSNLTGGSYMIDSTIDVIWTTWSAANATGELFTPPATIDYLGNFIVECEASMPADAIVGISVNGVQFDVAREDLIVRRADGTCVSAVQARRTDDIGRLGWPFLKTVVLFFDGASNPNLPTVKITAKTAHSSRQQVSTSSASSAGATTALCTASLLSTFATAVPTL